MHNKVKLVNRFIDNREEKYQYHLHHTYEIKPSTTYFESDLHPETLQGLIAFIEFHASDVYQLYSMEADEVLEVIDELFAQIKMIPKLTGEHLAIDQHENWEYFCGSKLESYDGFDNTGLMEYLTEMSVRNEWDKIQ